jgi:hypothetical protein
VQPFGLGVTVRRERRSKRVVQKPFELAAAIALLGYRSGRRQVDEFRVPARQIRISNHGR